MKPRLRNTVVGLQHWGSELLSHCRSCMLAKFEDCAARKPPRSMCRHLCAAGYPFDIPPLGAGLLTHCMLAYHLPLLIAFSTRWLNDSTMTNDSITSGIGPIRGGF